jgi:hypothetical protein
MWGNRSQPMRHRRAIFDISVPSLSGLAPLNCREPPYGRLASDGPTTGADSLGMPITPSGAGTCPAPP